MSSNVLHRLCLGLLLAAAPLALAGAEVHVSAITGDDQAPGSVGQPVATLCGRGIWYAKPAAANPPNR